MGAGPVHADTGSWERSPPSCPAPPSFPAAPPSATRSRTCARSCAAPSTTRPRGSTTSPPSPPPRPAARRCPSTSSSPADGLTVEAALPGVVADDVEVTLEKGKLSIRAEHAAVEGDAADEGRTYFLRERQHGSHARSILIGDGYDPDSVAGSLKDGVLTIRVQKAAQAQPRHVAITSA